MKKYFIKITVFLLLAFILPMTGGLCFQDLINSAVKINIAKAADDGITTDMDMDACRETEVANKAQAYNFNLKPEKTSPVSSHNNSLLPCCVGGTHPNLITSAQSLEIHKFTPFIISSFEKSPLSILQLISYQAPITAPPELASLQITILRL